MIRLATDSNQTELRSLLAPSFFLFCIGFECLVNSNACVANVKPENSSLSLTTILLRGTITKSLAITEETLFETHIVLCKTFVSWNNVQSLVWLLSGKDALRNNGAYQSIMALQSADILIIFPFLGWNPSLPNTASAFKVVLQRLA